MALPIERSLRFRMLGMGAALLVLAAIAVSAFNPYFSKRVNTFTFGFEAAGARPYLVKAGLNMFTDHPLTGVGAGGYQTAFENDYYRYKDPKIKANVTMSHTSVVTIMAELGIVGLVAVAFVAVRWAQFLRSLLQEADAELKAVLVGVLMISAIIPPSWRSRSATSSGSPLPATTGIAIASATTWSEESGERVIFKADSGY